VQKNIMPKQTTSLRWAAVAAIAALSLSLSMVTLARAQQTSNATAAAVTPVKKHKRSHYSQNETYQPKSSGCSSHQNMFPPCMSTWPEGSPHYHGGVHPGNTFDE